MNLFLLREAALDALALVMPVECAGCGEADRPVCARCRPAMTPDATSRLLPDGTRVFSGLDYEGVVRDVILAYKEEGRTELARFLTPALAAAVHEVSATLAGRAPRDPPDSAGRARRDPPDSAGRARRDPRDVVGRARRDPRDVVGRARRDPRPIELVTVPPTRRSRRRRGFDPVAALVSRAGLDRAHVFAPARPHAAQKTLSLEQRAVNLSEVFVARVPVAGRRFLLIDDVVTTGATLAAAASCLREAGAEVVAAAAVASTPRLFANAGDSHRERTVTFP